MSIYLPSLEQLDSKDYIIFVNQQSLLLDKMGEWSLLSVAQLSSTFKSLLKHSQLIPVALHQQGCCYVAIVDVDIDESQLIGFRALMSSINKVDKQLISRALQLITWHQDHQCCGRCGKSTQYHSQEHARHCPSCDLFFYPKIAPCMMCLITKGDYCLLAQHQKHPSGFYATLAGFVEAGESVEQTLHREVMEEVGLRVKNLSYFKSQSWPFPHQLMLGYFAEYDSGKIIIDNEEIVDAQWFHYSQLPQVPSTDSLSGMMIEAFVAGRQ